MLSESKGNPLIQIFVDVDDFFKKERKLFCTAYLLPAPKENKAGLTLALLQSKVK